MKDILKRLLVIIMSFYVGVSLETFWLNLNLEEIIKSSNNIPIEYKLMLLKHPLSFELTKSACGKEFSANVFISSDGEIIKRIREDSESFILAKQGLQEYLKDSYQILEEKQIKDSNNNQIGLKIVARFINENQKHTQLAIITIYHNRTTIIIAPTLWHAQEFEHYLIYR